MCGIAGFFTASGVVSQEKGYGIVKAMSDALLHRGPDADGHWADGGNGVFLGHRRLSIQDLSEAGAQPMTSHCGRYVLVYNGEIYNKEEVHQALLRGNSDCTMRGHSDTEVILEAFAALGIEATLNIMKGMFAVALWDKKERVMHFMRDHLGKKPLYIGLIDGKLGFASELKAFKPLTLSSLPLEPKAVESYRYYGFIAAPYSIYRGIYKLKPGHWMSVREEDLQGGDAAFILQKMIPYWRLRKPEKLRAYKRDELQAILSRAVQGRMISDVPLGAFLSGGVDSSLVSALMQEHSDTSIRTYSIGFDDAAFDESVHAKKIAQHLKTDHKTYMVNARDTLDVVSKLPYIYDEPFADYSQIPTVVLCQKARNDTVVAVSGDGGDEVFCGYRRYFMLKRLMDATYGVPKPMRKVMSALMRVPSQGFYNAVKLNGKRIHSIAGFLRESSTADAALRALSVYTAADRPGFQDLSEFGDLGGLEEMMMTDTHLYLPDDILVKVDRASMFSSLEVRSPLLDKDVIEYAWAIRGEDKVFDNGARGKYPLYDLLCQYVPQELVDRPKQGFTPPIASWLRGDLKDWAGDILAQDTPFYTVGEKSKLWNEFVKGKADHHMTIWAMVMAQDWYLNARI